MPSVYAGTIEPWLSQMAPDVLEAMPDVEIILRDLRPYVTGHPIDRDRHLSLVNHSNRLHAAWVPPNAQPGDIVCYFAGAPFPLVLRQRSELESHTLLGDSFVEGFDEVDALDLDDTVWQDLLKQSKDADAELKDWMASSDRTSLKENAGDLSKVTSQDNHLKARRLNILQEMRSLCRTADEALGWIKLR
ncbi:hypothetical protein CLAFUW4_09384 [Fulvia fulva]|uniref:Uncharacterized protein n=1 Tax=Passalora fulva TaxID=5499 RepID=A0A9Q8PG97_PASFU|nr:uncharacterized protein CLAFUR5_09483 [Fulvia fulva]KAK4613464.1 hypothetical protein CLAFUR4_09390 [Fulvia fulva]KAK4615150.1 hypothetical protein CLAFUR0_09381 [Fulvia fulva]UJO21951.1 hypothetical protein CLAFUR5_09483 [Fulvia fulva]WPV20002.1 hypothetical protein CLAFUW4_09384 [Fulvia fulva]WPV35603.1 hypothetical protein CLAFUW7_09385 [Fulvia fulva]